MPTADRARGRSRRAPGSRSSAACPARGKTAASKLLEDVGYRVVDNLPAELLRNLAQLVAQRA